MDGDDTFLYQGGSVSGEMITNVVVQEGVQRIDNFAFKNCYALVHVSIPDSVTSIGIGAFFECKYLKAIAIPDGVKTIEEGTFSRCVSLESIELPNSIISFGEDAFRRCDSLRTIAIPKGVLEIGERAFLHSGIQEFVVPNGIKVIPPQAFKGCLMLQTVELPSSVEGIGLGAFNYCCDLKNFVLPNGLPKLTKLDLNCYRFGVHGIDLITQLIVNSPNLEKLSLRVVHMKRTTDEEKESLNDDDMPMLLQFVSLCPSLRTLDVSYNSFTPKVFDILTSLEIPGHLRSLKMYRHDYAWCHGGNISINHDLLRVLEANPKLGIWTDQIWPGSEDQCVTHHLEMNRYGCRCFTVPDALWPLLIEKLAALEMKKETESLLRGVSRLKIETGAPNILYPLLHRHSELFLRLVMKGKRIE